MGPATGLLSQQRLDKAGDLVADPGLGGGRRVQSIVHHEFRAQHNIIQKEGHQRQVVGLGKIREDLLELLQIARPIVAGQQDLGQHRLGLVRPGELDHLGQVGPGDGGSKAPQPVVGAEFDQHPVRFVGFEQGGQAGQAALGRFTADAGIDEGVFSPLLLPLFIEQGRPALFGLHLVAGTQAVAQYQQGLGLDGRCPAAQATHGKQETHHAVNPHVLLSLQVQANRIPKMSSTPIIAVRGLGKTVRLGQESLTILEGIDLQVNTGETLALVGASGSGKSTLLGLLAGLDLPSRGEIEILGHSLTRLDEEGRARLRAEQVGFVFQSFLLLPTLSALENVMLPAELRGETDSEPRARELLAQVGLGERLHHLPPRLSGGEQQRVAIARAFMTRPSLLLADEPTGNLDSKTGETVIELLFRLNREHNTTLVVVTHDHELAQRCQRQLVMSAGRLEAQTVMAARVGELS